MYTGGTLLPTSPDQVTEDSSRVLCPGLLMSSWLLPQASGALCKLT